MTDIVPDLRTDAVWLRGSWKSTHHGLADRMDSAASEIERLRVALEEACQIALGTDLHREAVERVRELRIIPTAGQ